MVAPVCSASRWWQLLAPVHHDHHRRHFLNAAKNCAWTKTARVRAGANAIRIIEHCNHESLCPPRGRGNFVLARSRRWRAPASARCCRTSRRATPRGPCTLPPTTPRTMARTSSSTPSRPARSRSACGAASARRWQQMSSPTPASMCAQDTNHQRVCPTVAVLQQNIAAAQLCLSHPWARLRRCLLPVAVGAAGYRALSHGSEGRI